MLFQHSVQLVFFPALTLLYINCTQLRIKRLLSSFATTFAMGSNPKGSPHRENVSKALYPRKRAYQLSEKSNVAAEACTGTYLHWLFRNSLMYAGIVQHVKQLKSVFACGDLEASTQPSSLLTSK